jgi:hypothetical protein
MFLKKIAHFEDPKTKADITYQADTGRLSPEEALEVINNLPDFMRRNVSKPIDGYGDLGMPLIEQYGINGVVYKVKAKRELFFKQIK